MNKKDKKAGLKNSLGVMIYGWLMHGEVATRKLMHGLCLGIRPDKQLLTVSRLGELDGAGNPVGPPSEKEMYIVKAALWDALANKHAFGPPTIIEIEATGLLNAPANNGHTWFMYRLAWLVDIVEERENDHDENDS